MKSIIKEDINSIMQKFRTLSALIYNSAVIPTIKYLKIDYSNSAWDIIDNYKEINKSIFKIMVLNRFLLQGEYGLPINQIIIVPNYNNTEIFIENDKGDGNYYWDYPIKKINKNDLLLSFVEYFDFDKMSYNNKEFIKCKIIQSNISNEIKYKLALIKPDLIYFKLEKQIKSKAANKRV